MVMQSYLHNMNWKEQQDRKHGDVTKYNLLTRNLTENCYNKTQVKQKNHARQDSQNKECKSTQ